MDARIATAISESKPVPGHVCIVAEVPVCDLCGQPGYADVNLTGKVGRGWGMVCKGHFDTLGCTTGVGVGQIWKVADHG